MHDTTAFEALIVDPNKNYLEELVGDGKKFQTPEELAKGKAYSDAHIAQLEQEQQRLREELEQRLSLEKFLDKLNSSNSTNGTLGQPSLDDDGTDKSAMSTEQIATLVAAKVRELDTQKTAQQNMNIVNSKLAEVYGPNYSQKLMSQALELGMTQDELKNLGSRNPKALFKLLGLDSDRRPETFTTAPRPGVTSLPQGQKQGYSYFETLRKEKPTEYFSPRIQNQMFTRLKEMGEEMFYST